MLIPHNCCSQLCGMALLLLLPIIFSAALQLPSAGSAVFVSSKTSKMAPSRCSMSEPKIPCPALCGSVVGQVRGLSQHFVNKPECREKHLDNLKKNRDANLSHAHSHSSTQQSTASSCASAPPPPAPSIADSDAFTGDACDFAAFDDPDDPALPGVDFLIHQLQQQRQQHANQGCDDAPMDAFLEAKLELLLMLKRWNTPLTAFPEILKWAQSLQDKRIQINGSTTRESVIKQLKERFDLSGLDPQTTIWTLPGSGEKVKITVHDFLQCLCSLLTDPELMKEENLLIFEDENGRPFGSPPSVRGSDFILTDIHHGSVMKSGHKVHVKVHGRDLLVPIILCIDKTHVDSQGRLTLEPVSFTLGIFKKEVRRNPMAWHCLGCVFNQRNIVKKLSSLEKAQDYHFALGKILGSLAAVQKTEGISWTLPFGGCLHDVVLKVPILCVIGDTEGHDKLCGHCLNRTKSNCLCRCCNTPRDNTGDTTPFSETELCAPGLPTSPSWLKMKTKQN